MEDRGAHDVVQDEQHVEGAEQQVQRAGGGESTLTVLVALGANVVIALAKGVAAVLTGSASMAAETAHSVADSFNEVFLFIALRRSERPADRTHPFGYGQARYFWALLAAGSIFVTGALFSAYEGVTALAGGEEPLRRPLVSYLVLAVSFVLEGSSLVRGIQQTRGEAREHRLPWRAHLRRSDDPTATTVVFEDGAALVGLLLAATGVLLHQLTGSGVGDGVASLLIAVVLAVVAVRLGRSNMRLLIGVQADPRMVRAIIAWLGDQPEVEAVVDLVTVQLGTDQVLLCARLDLVDGLDSGEVERAMARMSSQVDDAFPDIADSFLQPVPRGDAEVRARVRARYGDDLARQMVEEAAAPSTRGGASAARP